MEPTADLVRDMGRRVQLATSEADLALPLPQREQRPQASVGRVVWRSLRWVVNTTVFGALLLSDRLRRRLDARQFGARLRQLFEATGGTGVKLGQQMAIRVDLLPFEVTLELGKLLDSVPPFDTADAIETVERAIGAPLHDVFDSFEPEPIGSASIACVYKARLKTGESVDVKVRRPNVGKSVADVAPWRDIARQVLSHPLVIAGASIALIVGIRKVWFRLMDKDLAA